MTPCSIVKVKNGKHAGQAGRVESVQRDENEKLVGLDVQLDARRIDGRHTPGERVTFKPADLQVLKGH